MDQNSINPNSSPQIAPATPQTNPISQPNTQLQQQPQQALPIAQSQAQQSIPVAQPQIQTPTPQPQMQPPTQPQIQPPTQPQIQSQTPQPQPTFFQPTPPIPDTQPTPDHPMSTHSTLLISELRDNMVVMKDGSFRTVIACQSINFDLMSETEREGVEYSFQSFLNSLNFTIQILIRSQRIDISPYIDSLINTRRKNDNMLLGVLMDDYINFIDILSQEVNIMDKSFFIVIPYYTSPDAEKVVQQTKDFFKSFNRTKAPQITKIDRATYDKAITEMNNRSESIINGLFQIGIRSVRLNTKELAQLYYNFNNPDTAARQPLTDFSKLANLYVKKGE